MTFKYLTQGRFNYVYINDNHTEVLKIANPPKKGSDFHALVSPASSVNIWIEDAMSSGSNLFAQNR